MSSGLIANLIIFSWFWKTFNSADVSFLTTLGVWILFSFILSVYFGVFAGLVGLLPRGIMRILLSGMIWVSLEYIRGNILTGFPWALFGHTMSHVVSIVQLASIAGVAGISYFLVTINMLFSHIGDPDFYHDKRKGIFVLVCALVCLIMVKWGSHRAAFFPGEVKKSVRVAFVQPNINQYEKWDRVYEYKIKAILESLVNENEYENVDLFIWPESAIPGWIPNNQYYLSWLQELVKKTGAHHVIGAVTRQGSQDYNAVFLFNSDGSIGQWYAKQHLVPFGEYIPFGQSLGRIIPYLGLLGTFDPGTKNEIFLVNGLRLAPNICYEAIFQKQISGSSQESDVLVNVTNDGWYLNTGAPEQHFVTNIFRAVENGIPVFRGANTGISSFIDSWGRPVFRSTLLERGLYVVDAYLDRPRPTFYSKWGNWFELISFIWIPFVYFGYVARAYRKNSKIKI